MDKEKLVKDILDREWKMFQLVQNKGGRATCQENEDAFRLMRGSQFEAWNSKMLESYQRDLVRAEQTGHNLLSEKYGYMMKSTFKDEYEEIRALLPPISPEKQQIVEEILVITIRQTRTFRAMYPNLGRFGRPLTTAEDGNDTSVETYTRGELLTYSMETLDLYLEHMKALDNRKILFPLIVMDATVRASGYASLAEAEKAYNI